jgi:ribonuclease T1
MGSRRIRAALAALAAAALAAGGIAVSSGGDEESPAPATSIAGEESAAITATLAAIDSGDLPYEEDGGVFQNRERLLPEQPLGYYREYTVETPGSPDRGARRLVIGEGGETYYTDDHYASFEEIDPGMFR